ncbi:Uncharacterised protein [Clostridioides difficile]|nr:Uncharacterised protein [Clostridioides difficile]
MGGNFYEEFTKKIDVFFIYLYCIFANKLIIRHNRLKVIYGVVFIEFA